jgi:DNA primase
VTLSPQWLDELRARVLLSAVVAPSVKLIKAGREFKACCPFHDEKTPSFYVNDEKHFYHCFGCGAHGDAIRFLTDARGLPFMDAVKELAGKAGMEVPAADPKMREKAERSAGLYDVTEAAQRWFVEQLDGVEGGPARAYLKERGISEATRKKFGFGFAPDSRGKLKNALETHGIDKLVEAGLLIKPDDGPEPDGGNVKKREPYDRFRGRLTYPIRDARGRTIAFSARILGPGEPKYLNSPDTPLFDKGRTLFNLDLAGPASRKAGRILIVEGQMDAIALDQAGIGEVVAPLGTALTEHQLERLWRLEPGPICCFDGDAAGQKAAVRAALRALPHLSPERTMRFVALPAGQDPDDVVRSGGKAAFEALLELSEPLVDRLWRAEVEAAPLDTPEARAGLRKRLLDHVQAIADPNVRQLYRDEWLSRFDAQFRAQQTQQRTFTPRGEWKRGKFTPPTAPVGQEARAIAQIGVAPAMAAAVVAGCIRHPSVLHDHVEQIALFRIADVALRKLRDFLVDFALSHPSLDSDLLATTLGESEHQPLVAKLLRPDRTSFSFNQKDADQARAFREFEGVLMMLVDKGLLENAFNQATDELKAEITEERLARQAHLRAAIRDVDNRLASLASSE